MVAAPWMSPARWQEYLVAANHDEQAARDLYAWNSQAAGAFFELVAHVEVAVRNAVDTVLRPLEVPQTARIESSAGWWFADPAFLAPEQLKYVATAKTHLGPDWRAKGRDKVFASMTFGLWPDMFGPTYENLFRQHLVYAFPHRPYTGFKRKSVQVPLLNLRTLRNRIAHHQAVFDQPLEERFEQAREILSWLSPVACEWALMNSRIPDILASRPAAAEAIALIVPARRAWPLYQRTGAYVCPPGRSFRSVSHVGFYAESAIQSDVAKVLLHLDDVEWSGEEIARRRAAGTAVDRRVADIIRVSRQEGWQESSYQVFILTEPSESAPPAGHLTLTHPLPQTKRGRGSAWVRRHRYVPLTALQTASTLGDLDSA